MKKIILACLITLFTGGALFAQQTQPAQEKGKTAKKEATHATTHAAKAADHQKQAATTAPSATATTAHLKKDGTPDKRYKQHKHMKKDGTPDKRFKENKQ